MSARDDDRGAATVLVLAMAGVLVFVGAAGLVVVAMVVAHRAAQSAADLAAIAGARGVAEGHDGCAAAAVVAEANRARLVSCAVTGRDVAVRVDVAGPHWLGQTADLGADARAGPGP
jgi:secretion/DNA translocation related TadE-like protein